MPISPEVKVPELSQEVREIQEEIPEYVEKSGISPRKTTFTAQVADDSGQNLISTPQTQNITIQIPVNTNTLTSWSKGSITNAITWLALFWLRAIKKAALSGWNVVVRREN